MENQNETTQANEQAPKLTRREQIEKKLADITKQVAAAQAKYAELTNELSLIDVLANIGAGSTIVAKLGRADTTREVDAIVTGVKEDEDGSKKYKITYGSGFDADLAVINASQIVSIR